MESSRAEGLKLRRGDRWVVELSLAWIQWDGDGCLSEAVPQAAARSGHNGLKLNGRDPEEA